MHFVMVNKNYLSFMHHHLKYIVTQCLHALIHFVVNKTCAYVEESLQVLLCHAAN